MIVKVHFKRKVYNFCYYISITLIQAFTYAFHISAVYPLRPFMTELGVEEIGKVSHPSALSSRSSAIGWCTKDEVVTLAVVCFSCSSVSSAANRLNKSVTSSSTCERTTVSANRWPASTAARATSSHLSHSTGTRKTVNRQQAVSS